MGPQRSAVWVQGHTTNGRGSASCAPGINTLHSCHRATQRAQGLCIQGLWDYVAEGSWHREGSPTGPHRHLNTDPRSCLRCLQLCRQPGAGRVLALNKASWCQSRAPSGLSASTSIPLASCPALTCPLSITQSDGPGWALADVVILEQRASPSEHRHRALDESSHQTMKSKG